MAHFVVFGAILLRPKKKQIGAQKNKKGHAPPKSGPKLKGGRPDHSPPKTANASARLAWNRRSAAWYGALKVRSGEMLPFFARRLLLLMMINVISQHLPGCGDLSNMSTGCYPAAKNPENSTKAFNVHVLRSKECTSIKVPRPAPPG